VALAESCFNPESPLGAEVNLDAHASHSEAAILFNEAQSRILISVSAKDAENALQKLGDAKVSAIQIGKVGGSDLVIRSSDQTFRWPVADLHDQWWNAISRALASNSSGERLPSL
jgi:phosphoribosylformylglycinamidine synthase